MHNKMMPESIKIMHTKDGYPATGSPYIRVFAIINTIYKNEKMQKSMPIKEDNAKGAVEKATIPSNEYNKSL